MGVGVQNKRGGGKRSCTHTKRGADKVLAMLKRRWKGFEVV